MVYNDEAHKRVFLLSNHDRDGLTSKIKSLDWGVIAARRSDNLLSRFIGAAASIAVIDIRNISDEAFTEIQELSSFIEANGFTLIAVLDLADQPMINYAQKIGATQFIDPDGSNIYWNAALDAALQFVTRLQGNGSPNTMDERHSRSISNSWIFNLKSFEFDAGPSIKHAINQNYSETFQKHYKEIYPKSHLLRFLSKYQRRMGIAAYRRLSNGDDQSGFSHSIGDQNFIHHLELDDNIVRGYMEEVSEIKAWRSHDLLTGVRSGSFARNHLLNWKHSVDGDLSLIIIGLRQLEQINSRFGRAQGNAVIQMAGDRICTVLAQDSDPERFVSRISGKEFLILYNGKHDLDMLKNTAENIIEALLLPYDMRGEDYHISARAAICKTENGEDGIAALRRVTMTLTEVMNHPNMIISVADTVHDEHFQYGENIERELRSAIDANQIEVVLQPQFDIKTAEMIGAEALARWNHPTLGKLGAGILFSVADRCDYRDIISQHIQNLALKTCAKWPLQMRDLRLSVNVTPQQMSMESFSDEFAQTISDSGFDPRKLTIELTEENLIQNIDMASKSLLSLREKGIKIAIDDFGTGYSSLAYITELPLDYLKLDKALIRNILRSNKDLMVLRSIIAMGRAVGVKVIAEGVESNDILTLLRTEKCHIYQGYFGSKPLSIARFEKFAIRSLSDT